MFNTPVLFLVFNRPDTTAKVFEVIRQVKPARLFIAADGPRAEREGEEDLCRRTRQLVLTGIDWDCEVKTLFRDENLGCGKAVSNAITWFFEQVEEGIILEDDTLPNKSFFAFCTELLKRYEFNDSIMHISGNNFQFGIKRGDGDYYYSKYSHIWGWATWKRAWKKYDYYMSDWVTSRENLVSKVCGHDNTQVEFWNNIFDHVYKREIDTWDYQWLYTLWKNQGVSILPNQNLVINIGFGANATHTKQSDSFISKMQSNEMKTINRPSLYNTEADLFSFHSLFNPKKPRNVFFLLSKVKPIFKNVFFKNV